MDDFTAYRIYMAIKLHFGTKNYDVFASRGAVKGISRDNFSNRKGASWFKTLAKKFKDPQEYVQYLVANAAYGSVTDVFDLQTSFDNYSKWIKHKQMSTRLIKDNLSEYNTLSPKLEGTPPAILNDVISGKCHVETAVAINRYQPFISSEILDKDYLIFTREALRIKKLDRFVKYNTDEINSEIQSKLTKYNV